jgi:hypothetical protein
MPHVQAEELATVIGRFGTFVGNAGTLGFKPETAADYAYLREQYTAQIPALERYKAICGQRFSGQELETITGQLDEWINKRKDDLKQASDPEWVTAQIEATRQRKSQPHIQPPVGPVELELGVVD